MRSSTDSIPKDHSIGWQDGTAKSENFMERFKYIIKTFGADWKDLPNISVKLPDGTTTHVLQYPYNTKRDEKLRPGVCHCLTGPKQACYEEDRQDNTLVPDALSHTGSRHNDWSGLYGRIHYESYL